MSAHRKKPFSHKQKKAQILEKRTKKKDGKWDWERDADHTFKQGAAGAAAHQYSFTEEKEAEDNGTNRASQAGITQRTPAGEEERASGTKGPGSKEPASRRLESVFAKLPPNIVELRKRESMQPIVRLPETALEVSLDDLYSEHGVIEIPKRPQWKPGESKAVVETREEQYFRNWMDTVYGKYPAEDLSYFEHNLEVWRQLWRVAELSDIVLFVVDARHPVLHFPPSLYQYVVNGLRRKLVLVFNKIDLVGQDAIAAWSSYFKERFPGLLTAAFSCYPADGFLQTASAAAVLKSRVRRRYKRYYRAVGVLDVLKACRDVQLVKNEVAVDWEALISKAAAELKERADSEKAKMAGRDKEDQFLGRSRRRQQFELVEAGCEEGEDEEEGTSDEDENEEELLTEDFPPEEHELNNNMITIGLLGHPNVGKSSLINSIVGRKVVSTSRTPGHTKHFQTIHLTSEVRLCDCPGLVFPALLPKPVQILSGMYRIAQVQEPYTAIKYLAERVPLEDILSLHHPDQDPSNNPRAEAFQWSAWNMCEAFALMKGFLTSRAARPDVYRSANAILRMVNDGRILLSFVPPGFYSNRKCPGTGNASNKYLKDNTRGGSKRIERGAGDNDEDDAKDIDDEEEDEEDEEEKEEKCRGFGLLEEVND
ncbi:Guanine nucleotide-binding-like protein 1 [Borealophlyctis nickersoniae]|nr:Guanine nucleotide-binding-like protein 1 [Borealophlyctis nickersoniae]